MLRIVNNRKRLEIRRDLRKKITRQELLLWNEIRNNKLGCKFRRQVSVGPYFADFYCKENNLVIEIDGAQHLENKEYDKERERYMQSFGLITLRFWNFEIENNLNDVLNKIKNTFL
jgi:adenine-specific DNA-methyltransferase